MSKNRTLHTKGKCQVCRPDPKSKKSPMNWERPLRDKMKRIFGLFLILFLFTVVVVPEKSFATLQAKLTIYRVAGFSGDACCDCDPDCLWPICGGGCRPDPIYYIRIRDTGGGTTGGSTCSDCGDKCSCDWADNTISRNLPGLSTADFYIWIIDKDGTAGDDHDLMASHRVLGPTGTLDYSTTGLAANNALNAGSCPNMCSEGVEGDWNCAATIYWKGWYEDTDSTPPNTPTIDDQDAPIANPGYDNDTTINIRWTGVDDPDSGTSGYRLWLRECTCADCSSFTEPIANEWHAGAGGSYSRDYTSGKNGYWYQAFLRAENGAASPTITNPQLSSWVNSAIILCDTTAPPAPTVSSSTHPDQNTWYNHNDPALSWSCSDISGIIGYSYVLDQTAGTIPDTVSEGTGTSTSYTDKAEGVWYFHIRACNGVGLWGATTAHYTVRIDISVPPTPTMHDEPYYTKGWENTVSWDAVTDTGSGLQDYHVICDNDTDTTSWLKEGWPTGTSYTFTFTDPECANIKYFYRVKARDALHESTDWSSAKHSTQDCIDPDAPDLVSPPTDEFIDDTTPTLDWEE